MKLKLKFCDKGVLYLIGICVCVWYVGWVGGWVAE